MANPRIESLKEKFEELRSLDKGLAIFGSTQHQYAEHDPLPENEIQQFEQRAGIRLPGDYRAYLNTMSNGGGGPYYGLYSLENSLKESFYYFLPDDDTVSDWPKKIEEASKGDLKEYFTPFPVSSKEVAELMRVNESYEDDEWRTIPLPEKLTGFLLLCEYGCGGYYILVVNGDQAGTVWFFQTEEYFNPCYTNGKQWDFYDFMEWWVTDSLLQLKDPQARYKNNVSDPRQKKELIYDQQELTDVPEEVYACVNLKKLMLSRNKIAVIPERLFELKELRILNLEMNLFEEIPASIDKLSELRVLKLNYCSSLKRLPASIGNLKNLVKLGLSYCSALLALPDEFGMLSNLRELQCYRIPMKQLPSTFSNLPSLEVLNIYFDEPDLDSIFTVLSGCPKLRSFTIKEANHFPSSLSKLKSVKEFGLQKDYAIDSEYYLASEITQTNIEKLYMLETSALLPDSIGEMQSLRNLYLSPNQMLKLPPSIKNLKNLESINCSCFSDDEISAQQKASFREMLPGVTLSWY